MKLGHRYLRCGVVVLSGVYMEGSLGTVASPSGAVMNGNPAIFRAVLHDFSPQMRLPRPPLHHCVGVCCRGKRIWVVLV